MAGYYDPLLALCDRAVAEGFVHPANRAILVAADDVTHLLDRLGSGSTRNSTRVSWGQTPARPTWGQTWV